MRQPIKFLPYLKTTEWGGEEISRFKNLSINCKNIGESWELSAKPGCESIVMDGDECGMTLADLMRKYGHRLVGESVYKHYGDSFPIVVKLIDSQSQLSIHILDHEEKCGYACHPEWKNLPAPLATEGRNPAESLKIRLEKIEGQRHLSNPEDSFMGMVCTEGSGCLKVDGISTPVRKGETLLLPAKTDEFDVEGALTLLTIVMPSLMNA